MKEAKREVSRIQMEAEARKQELAREAAAQKRAAEAARREEQARAALDRNLELQRQWRESEALKQVWPLLCELCVVALDAVQFRACRSSVTESRAAPCLSQASLCARWYTGGLHLGLCSTRPHVGSACRLRRVRNCSRERAQESRYRDVSKAVMLVPNCAGG